jgi:hypothetical protein
MRFAIRPSLRRFASRFLAQRSGRSRTCLALVYNAVLVLKTSGLARIGPDSARLPNQVPVFNYGMQPVVTGSL